MWFLANTRKSMGGVWCWLAVQGSYEWMTYYISECWVLCNRPTIFSVLLYDAFKLSVKNRWKWDSGENQWILCKLWHFGLE